MSVTKNVANLSTLAAFWKFLMNSEEVCAILIQVVCSIAAILCVMLATTESMFMLLGWPLLAAVAVYQVTAFITYAWQRILVPTYRYFFG
ncbi:hypothetical protein BH11PAT4_BH11PAT4_8350 [soil metagenome]